MPPGSARAGLPLMPTNARDKAVKLGAGKSFPRNARYAHTPTTQRDDFSNAWIGDGLPHLGAPNVEVTGARLRTQYQGAMLHARPGTPPSYAPGQQF